MFTNQSLSLPVLKGDNVCDYYWNIKLLVSQTRSDFELTVESRLFHYIRNFGMEWGTYHRKTPFGHIITFAFIPIGLLGHLAVDFDVMNKVQLAFLKNFSRQSYMNVVVCNAQYSMKFEMNHWALEQKNQNHLGELIHKSLKFNSTCKNYNFDRASDYLDEILIQEHWNLLN